MTEDLVVDGAFETCGDVKASLRVEVLEDLDSVFALRDSIEDLCQDLVEPNVFFEPWFLFPALRHLGTNEEFRFLCLYEVGGQRRLCGMLPLAVTKLHRLLPLRIHQAWAHQQCFRCTPLVRRGFADAFWCEVLSWLGNSPWHRRLLELQRFPISGEIGRDLQAVLRQRPAFRTQLYRYETAFLRCGPSYDNVLQRAMSRSSRSKLGRKRRRLARSGSLQFTEAGEGGSLDRLIDEFLELEASGWKGRAGTALASRQREAAFFRDVIHAAYDRGRLVILSLKLDGRMIAARCALLAPSGAFHFKSAYDEAYGRFSPGTLTAMEETRRMHDPDDALRADLTWADSCAGPGDGATYQCWPDRMAIARLRITPHWAPHALPLVVWGVIHRMAQARSRS